MARRIVLGSKAFQNCFALDRERMSSNDRDNVEDESLDGVATTAGDEGESYHSRDKHPRSESPRDESVEYIGTIKKEMRNILHRLPDLTLLR